MFATTDYGRYRSGGYRRSTGKTMRYTGLYGSQATRLSGNYSSYRGSYSRGRYGGYRGSGYNIRSAMMRYKGLKTFQNVGTFDDTGTNNIRTIYSMPLLDTSQLRAAGLNGTTPSKYMLRSGSTTAIFSNGNNFPVMMTASQA